MRKKFTIKGKYFYDNDGKYIDLGRTWHRWLIAFGIVVYLLFKLIVFSLDVALDNHMAYLDYLEEQMPTPEGYFESLE